MKNNNFYILSTGRSGSTLLQQILNAHPNIVVPYESKFLLHLKKKYENVKTWNIKIIKSFIDDLYTDRKFRLIWQAEREKVEKAMISLPITNFSDACNVVRSTFDLSFEYKEIHLFGDKNPMYSSFIDAVFEVNPEAKIIHLVRDPRGVGNGQINTFGRKDAFAIGYAWTFHNNSILKIQKIRPHQYYCIYYESLIKEPAKCLQGVCDFLEVDYNPQILEYRKRTKRQFNNYPERVKKYNQSLMKPIKSEIATHWKTQLTLTQKNAIEYSSYELAQRLGYQFEKHDNSFMKKVRLIIAKSKFHLVLIIINLIYSGPFLIRKWLFVLVSRLRDHKLRPVNKKG